MTEKTAWQIDPLDGDIIAQVAPRIDGDVVCQAPERMYDLSRQNWPERARLICAAPDLLAACEKVLAWRDAADPFHSWHYETQPVLEAAVAKATGAGELVGLPDEPKPCSEPEPIDTPDCPCCAETPAEPAPPLKTWWVNTGQGEILKLQAERIIECLGGGLALMVGDAAVARVASGRWIAYWQGGFGDSYDE